MKMDEDDNDEIVGGAGGLKGPMAPRPFLISQRCSFDPPGLIASALWKLLLKWRNRERRARPYHRRLVARVRTRA